MRADRTKWQITVAYGPQGDAEKLQFLQEIKAIPRPAHGRWLILGDFNFIYQAEDKNNINLNRRLMGAFKAAIDKNNINLNRRLMGAFKAAIDELNLKEQRLNGCRFT
ncbi:unnamed protein product [Miscanthus lutarioriparius]|uniref:Endonuclease/exonuclease/phosphatase domain-containing protein n=1 Tax=Miscanthus lutarioriparius TaxID=422564 RepID=A0A811QE98_9POAL|nr:unnamed protein product [Miscanthus lutarioriparius]